MEGNPVESDAPSSSRTAESSIRMVETNSQSAEPNSTNNVAPQQRQRQEWDYEHPATCFSQMKLLWRKLRACLLKLAVVPLMFVAFLIFVVFFAVFGILPAAIIFLILLCCYYCCTPHPLPLPVLWHALMSADSLYSSNNGGNNGAGSNHDHNASTAPLTAGQIRANLIRRRFLKVVHVVAEDNKNAAAAAAAAAAGPGNNQRVNFAGAAVTNIMGNHTCSEMVYLQCSCCDEGKPPPLSSLSTASTCKRLIFSEPVAEKDRATTMERKHRNQRSCDQLPSNGGDNDDVEQQQQQGVAADAVSSVPHYQLSFEEEGGGEEEEEERDQLSENSAQHQEQQGTDTLSTHSKSEEIAEDEEDLKKKYADGREAEDCFLTSSSRERGTACDICLLDYRVGDVVAWSRNPQCDHCFHEDCIVDWLSLKPTCPSCRNDYLVLDDDVEDGKNRKRSSAATNIARSNDGDDTSV